MNDADRDPEDLAWERLREFSDEAASRRSSPPAPDDRGWGVPDWREADAYPKAYDLIMEEWRWEFLRRNHGYRADYIRPESSYVGITRQSYFGIVYELSGITDPRKSSLQYRVVIDDGPIKIDDGGSFIPRLASSSYIGKILLGAGPKHLFLKVDLRRGLRRQFDELYLLAKIYQREHREPRVQKGRLSTYLRVLDARDARAGYRKIAQELLRHKHQTDQAARDMVKAAEKLRSHWPF